MYILGLETSCDESAVSLIEYQGLGRVRVLAEAISSQTDVHSLYGGVVPELAAREHLRNLPLLIDKVCKDAKVALAELKLIGVTRGPGLKGCLLIGLGCAKGLAVGLDLPLVGVNHIEGHLFAACLNHPDLRPPFLALVVSGGHTEIVEVRGLGDYYIQARTLDDAAGETFDKSAHLLGFRYPGGPALAALADLTSASRFSLPTVAKEIEGFSFSGLKTAISLLIEQHASRLPELKGELAYAAQEAIVEALCFKLNRALKKTRIATVVVTGGVSANRCLRSRVEQLPRVKAYFPEPRYCTDNATMIALVAGMRFERGEQMALESSVEARWFVEQLA